jgi:hypothetical protein
MSDFLYLFRAAPLSYSPQEMQQQMQLWMSWMKDLTDGGHLKSRGERLDPRAGKVVGKNGAATDGPYTEAKDIVGGYMVIQATDLEQAAKLAAGCPVLAAGGHVEVRPIMKM